MTFLGILSCEANLPDAVPTILSWSILREQGQAAAKHRLLNGSCKTPNHITYTPHHATPHHTRSTSHVAERGNDDKLNIREAFHRNSRGRSPTPQHRSSRFSGATAHTQLSLLAKYVARGEREGWGCCDGQIDHRWGNPIGCSKKERERTRRETEKDPRCPSRPLAEGLDFFFGFAGGAGLATGSRPG